MPASPPSPSLGQRIMARLTAGSIAGAIAVAALGFSLLFASSDRMQAARESEQASAIEAEDREFCSRLGIEPHAQLYPECRAGLREIRTRHQLRSADLFY